MRRSALVTTSLLVMSGVGLVPAAAAETPLCLNLTTFEVLEATIEGTDGPDVLTPRETWQDRGAYDEQARKLAAMFADNFRAFEADAAPDVRAAGPHGE